MAGPRGTTQDQKYLSITSLCKISIPVSRDRKLPRIGVNLGSRRFYATTLSQGFDKLTANLVNG
jgi:hypothetical protein